MVESLSVPVLAGADLQPGRLTIRWEDGQQASFSLLWLRDSCGCERCRHAETGQRLLDTIAIDGDPTPESLQITGDELRVLWAGEKHASCYFSTWLKEYANAQPPKARQSLWRAELGAHLPEAEFQAVTGDERELLGWLEAVDRFGFAVLHGVPIQGNEVVRVVELFGYVRETNYGRVFDVRSLVNPNNLAYTSLALAVHTDNPYRDPTPTLQLLHCLSSSADGGENILVDGFRVAGDLRAREPEAFNMLAGHSILFRFQDASTDLSTGVPVISVDAGEEITAIHFNNRSRQPIALPADAVEAYYRAYRKFGRMLADPAYEVRVKLAPGDLLIVDNLRVLHGRTGFSAAGERHVQGCYADRDGLRSKLAVLRRRQRCIDALFQRFETQGGTAYLGEPVSQTEHMLQAAYAAEKDGAGSTLIAAALLHDYGHLLTGLPEDSAEHGIDTRHEDLAHAFLARRFGPAVVEPIRLHVAAKRYLRAVDPAYLQSLSPASTLSLSVQGGPMSAEEIATFESSPYARDALRLRRYDDIAKIGGLDTPGLEHYRTMLEEVLVDSL